MSAGEIVSSIFSVVLIASLIWLTVQLRKQEQDWREKLRAERAGKFQKHGTDWVSRDSDGVEMYRVCHCSAVFPSFNELRQHQIEQAELTALFGPNHGR